MSAGRVSANDAVNWNAEGRAPRRFRRGLTGASYRAYGDAPLSSRTALRTSAVRESSTISEHATKAEKTAGKKATRKTAGRKTAKKR